MTIFDSSEDSVKKKKAVELFVNTFKGSYQKLDANDADYKIFDKDSNLIAYAEVCTRIRNMSSAYPLPVHAKRLIKLIDKRMPPVLIWSCDDGIIYGKANKLRGEVIYTDHEVMVFYEKQKELKYVRFV